ncbi:hypothetical protein GQ43DRAFT_438789 [Delitschia confertaspora ATCC 74209]|uniref:Uncharacterized protein n=1 Tax=Delitschia confertaspora ATCC 74209 TaxID=1513339 RepID=A0A9P4N151_9PLEO|nr:hypothetical protein GQ43DRAFT_438789 [Delitschia confertaspora ATCC 74209]
MSPNQPFVLQGIIYPFMYMDSDFRNEEGDTQARSPNSSFHGYGTFTPPSEVTNAPPITYTSFPPFVANRNPVGCWHHLYKNSALFVLFATSVVLLCIAPLSGDKAAIFVARIILICVGPSHFLSICTHITNDVQTNLTSAWLVIVISLVEWVAPDGSPAVLMERTRQRSRKKYLADHDWNVDTENLLRSFDDHSD